MSCSIITSKGTKCKKKPHNDQNICLYHINRGKSVKESSNKKHNKLTDKCCSQMIPENGKYKRCSNSREKGQLFCAQHERKNEDQKIEIWMPPIIPIIEEKKEEHKQCYAHFWPLPSSKVPTRCVNKPTISSLEGRYCSTHMYTYRLTNREECSICLSPNDESKDVPLHCGHLFHSACLVQNNNSKCPNCRTDMNHLEKARYIRVNYDQNTINNLRRLMSAYSRIFFQLYFSISNLRSSLSDQNSFNQNSEFINFIMRIGGRFMVSDIFNITETVITDNNIREIIQRSTGQINEILSDDAFASLLIDRLTNE